MQYTKEVNNLTNKNLDQIWQRERDLMGFAFTASENAADRTMRLVLGDMGLEKLRTELAAVEEGNKQRFLTDLLFGKDFSFIPDEGILSWFT